MRSLSHLALPSATPFPFRDRHPLTVSSGVPAVDSFIGGIPRGALTEICGPSCSGRTSLLLAALAARTAQGEICALVDASDSFDPLLGRSAGVRLDQVLWVRCSEGAPGPVRGPRRVPGRGPAPGFVRGIDQALRATDLLIQAGGFGFIAVDLSDVPPRLVRRIPLSLWFRFRRAVEDTSTILMVLEQDPHAKTCASLVLRFAGEAARWKFAQPRAKPQPVSVSCLFSGLRTRMEVVRSRLRPPAAPVIEFRSPGSSPLIPGSATPPGALETETPWKIPDARDVAP